MGVDIILPARGADLDARDLSAFAGIRVLGDVHGGFDAFAEAMERARAEGMFVVQLGDLIDRGAYSPLCVELMLEAEEAGRATFVPGNHEAALAGYVLHGVGGAVTRQETLLQFEAHGGDLLERFVSRIVSGPTWLTRGDHFFVHAAFHPAMLTGRAPDGIDLGAIAMHGYGTSAERRANRFARTWVDAIPRGRTVVVGHAVTASRSVERAEGRQCGAAVFVDTGSWIDEDGPLGAYDVAA